MDSPQTLTIAAEIQQSLLPENYPQLSHFDLAAVSIPVDKVGGDFYDFIKLGEDQLGILIGDVTGHGLSAAIFMAAVKSQLLREAKRTLSPATAITATHRKIVNLFASQLKFVTVTYGVLSQLDQRFTVTTAGMIPYWIKSERAACIELQSPGVTFPLGIRLMREEYESRDIVLSPEDTLVFYSDGLIEARNQQGKFLGYERLKDLLLSYRQETAFGIVKALITTMTDFTSASPLEDDLTIVVLKAAPPPPDIPLVAERPRLQGERKPAAVMICHVVDKSGEAVDFQQLFSSTGNSLHDGSLLATLQDTYGGIFELLSESTLVGLFGVPKTYEDNAQRALAAAWELKARLAEVNLSMRAGIHTGTLIFRPDAAIDYSLMGETFNLALQLSYHAPEGRILLSKRAHQLARGAFEVETADIREIDLGIVLAVKQPAVIPAQRRETALVGRTAELESLHQCLNRLIEGQGQIVSIIGEAGIGKSRLVMELKTDSSEQGINWLEGRCTSIGQSISYRPFLDILRTYFNLSEEDGESEMALKVTENVTNLFPQRAESFLPFFGNLLSIKFGNELDDRLMFATPEQIRHQTLIRLRDFFVGLGKQQPLLLILDDLHWSDDLSLDLLSLLMEELATTPLMLLCVYRPGRKRRISQLSSQVQQKCLDQYTEIRLQPLSDLQSRQLVEKLLQIKNLPENIKDMILQKAEGNPFFIEEVVRSLQEQDLIFPEGEHFQAPSILASIDVPDTIQSLVLARVDRLQPEAKHILQCAAVIGRLFKYRLLQHLTPQKQHLDGYLNDLEALELIYQERTAPELGYAFRHALTQEATYQSILEQRRREFHLKVAIGIERLYRERLEEYYEELAHHYSASGDAEKAVEYLLLAGEKSRRAYLNDEAIGYFQRALEFLNDSPLGESRQDWRLAALKGLGQIYHGIGKEPEAEKYFRQAIILGQEMGLAVLELVRLYSYLMRVLFWQSRYDEVIRLGDEGLALLGDDTQLVEAAVINQDIAASYSFKGNINKFREFTYRTAQFIQHLPYSEELRPAYSHIATLYTFDQKVEEALKWLDVFKRKAEQHHDLRALGEVYYLTAVNILAPQGDLREAILHFQQGLELFTGIGDTKHISWCLINLGRVFLLLGDLQQTAEYASRGLEAAEALGNKREMAWAYDSIGTLFLCQSAWEEAVKVFQKIAQFYREMDDNFGEAQATSDLGRAYLAQGERLEALRQFQAAVALAGTDALTCADALSGFEEAYDAPEESRACCRRFREEHPEIEADLSSAPTVFVQWYLEPTQPFDFPQNLFHDDFDSHLSSDWFWHDPFGDCSFTVQNGLEIRAVNGRYLWEHTNRSAPRLLQPVSGDFAVQTVLAPISGENPAIGGLLLWKDRANFLRLDKGTKGAREISFVGYFRNEDVIIGRGYLPSERVFLRLERRGNHVNALCSVDAVNWFTVGQVVFSADDAVDVGLHAIGSINRKIYHGAYPDGTAIRFESFQLWGA